MKTAKQILLFLSLSLALASCGDDRAASKSESGDAEAQYLISEVDGLLFSVERGLLLKNTNDRQEQTWQNLLYDSKLALIRLAQDGQSLDAITYLHRVVELMLDEPLHETDEQRISSYINSLNQLVVRLAEAQNLDLKKLLSSLYRTSFANGLEPFTTEASNAAWVMDKAMEATYASVGGFQNKAWLISPLFDLTHVSEAALSIRHTILINRNTGNFASDPFDRAKILKTAFKAKVSTNYTGENPETATWEDVSLDPLPVSIDFHTVTTPNIDLSKYAGKKITIAFYYDMDASLGRHYPTWQINQFNLLGSSTEFRWMDHENTKIKLNEADLTFIYQHDFANGLTGFNQVTEKGKPFPWAAKTTPKGQKYMEWSNFAVKTPGVNWLVSNVFDLNGVQNAALSVNHSINFAPKIDLTQIYAAEVGNRKSASVSDLNWQRLEFDSYPSGSNWNLVKSEWLLLPANLQGKKIVVGFRHESQDKIFPNWGLYNFDLAGTASAKGKVPVDDSMKWSMGPGQASQNQVKYNTLFKHDFIAKGIETFTLVTEEGELVTPTIANNPNNTPSTYVLWSAFDKKIAGKNWLISSSIDLSKAKEAFVSINHTINHTADLNSTKVFAALAPEDGVPPSAALDWQDLNFTTYPSGKSWDAVQTDWLKLPANLQGKKIVLGFRYISAAPNSYPNWRLYHLEIGTPDKSANQQSQAPLQQLPSDAVSVYKHDFAQGIDDFTLIQESGAMINPKSQTNPNNGEVYIEWSAFAEKLEGVTRMISKPISLDRFARAMISIDHSINFNKDLSTTQIYVAIAPEEDSLEAELNWIPLAFSNYPTGTVWDKVKSEWLKLPDAVQGKTIVLGFRYEASKDAYPNWRFYNLEIKASPN